MELLLFAGAVLSLLGEGDGEQGLVGCLFEGTGGLPDLLGDAFLKVGADLVFDVLFEPADDESLVAEIIRRVVLGVADGGGIQQAHEGGKAAGGAIVRGGGEQDEGVGATCEETGKARAPGDAVLVAAGGDIVTFVDEDDVPPGVLEIVPVLEVVLEGVDGDDRPVVKVERIVVAGDVVADALQAGRIEADKRDGKAAPKLLLELGEHALEGDHQNALPAAALDEFGGEDARFERLAEAYGVGDEDALPRLAEGLEGGIELVGNEVHHPAVAKADLIVAGGATAQLRFEIQEGAVEVGTGVGNKLGFGWVEDDYLFLERGEELRGASPHQFGDAFAGEQKAAVRGGTTRRRSHSSSRMIIRAPGA